MSPGALGIAALGLSSSSPHPSPTILYPPSSHYHQGFAVKVKASIPIAFPPHAFYLRRNGNQTLMANQRRHHHQLRLRCVNESSDNSSQDQTDSTGKENHQQVSLTTNEILKRLKRYGVSGVLSYGLLNTAYYLSTFLFVWLYVVPAPGKMGYVAAAERFFKILAMVWAGSQVTKLIRAGWALALAPAVDRGLSWFTIKYKFESQGKAFMAIAGFCFGLAFVVFLVLTLLWA